MSGQESLYLDTTQVSQYSADLTQQMPVMLRGSTTLHRELAAKLYEAGGKCEVVWPPDGPYRAHYTIVESSIDPSDKGLNVTEGLDNHHLYRDSPVRIGVNVGRFATRWIPGGESRPLLPDEISRIADRIANGRVVLPSEVAQDGRVYKRHSLRYVAHRIAKTIFGADF